MTKRELLSPQRTRDFLDMNKVQVYELVEQYYMDYEDFGHGDIAVYVDELERYLDALKSSLHFSYMMQCERDSSDTLLLRRDARREALSSRSMEAGWYWGEDRASEVPAK